MIRKLLFVTCIVFVYITPAAFAQGDPDEPAAPAAGAAPAARGRVGRPVPPNPGVIGQIKNYSPITKDTHLNPSPDDWLMFSRTYDAQRFSPLKQINKDNVWQLRQIWSRGMQPGSHEGTPIVHQGVMYVANARDIIQALDATNGELLWEHRRKLPDDWEKFTDHKLRSISLFENMLYFASADGFIVALDARTGEQRWQTMAHDYHGRARHTTGPVVIDGKVITGRGCANDAFFYPAVTREGSCFISAHDALTGKELWKFYTAAGPGEPGGDTWGNTPPEKRTASPWGTPGSYDPVRKLIYWGIANPSPYPRLKRHLGNIDDIPRSSPADLFSNSTVALDPETGKMVWYYQHLPGDDWDLDHGDERILFRTALNPDPNFVKWINPRIRRGEERDIAVSSTQGGGIWVVDRSNGQFLWATPFPFDTPQFGVAKIDVETGKTFLNTDLIFKQEGDRHIICYEDQKGWWPMAYHPGKNSLYIPYQDFCIDMQESQDKRQGWSIRNAIPRPGSDPNALGGIAKVNMSTGQIQRIYTAPVGGNGAMLATAGDLLFWGDANRRFRAFDADSGKILWETTLEGSVENSTITYAVNGKQYVAVLTQEGSGIRKFIPTAVPSPGHNAVYVFALAEKR